MGRTAPGPFVPPLIGNTLQFARDPLQFYVDTAARYGDIARIGLMGRTCFLLNHPDHVRHVLQGRVDNYVKSSSYRELARLLGNGLLTSEGALWKRHRRVIQPAFHRKSLDQLVDTMFACADEAGEAVAQRTGGVADISAACMQASLSIVGRALFGTGLGHRAQEVEQAIRASLVYINARAEAPYPLPYRIPTPRKRAFEQGRARLDALVQAIIAERRRADHPGDDLLGMLLTATDEDGQGLSDEELRDEVLTMVGAGYETTATTLSWTLAFLSEHAAVRERAEQAAERAWNDADRRRAVLADDVLDRVLKESMRLRPPVWSITRLAVEDDAMGGYAVPAGSVAIVSPYLAHRDARYWANPEGFDLDHFAPEVVKDRDRQAYLPFGAGQRKCIGERMAMMEMKVILARLLVAFRLDLIPGKRPVPAPSIVLRPAEPLLMRVSKR